MDLQLHRHWRRSVSGPVLVSLKLSTALLLLLEWSTPLPTGPISSDQGSEILLLEPLGSHELAAELGLDPEPLSKRRKRQIGHPPTPALPLPRSVIFETCNRLCMRGISVLL